MTYADQLNFGISLVSASSEWVLRIDADEYLEPDWHHKLTRFIRENPEVHGVAVRRVMMFKSKPIRFGLAQTWQLRLFRNGYGRCELRWMDEHIVVGGAIGRVNLQLIDDNRNDVRWWTQKHLGYADREAVDLLLRNKGGSSPKGLSFQARVKRTLKEHIYGHLPLSIRATFFFLARYFIFGGFLDGSRGFQFHFLQGWWYRLYTDLRVQEIKAVAKEQGLDIEQAIEKVTGIQPNRLRCEAS
jgi:glycosyltransferase involved in cell wall biosynthesis